MKVTFLSLLGIVFIVLKLTHVIDWSWWFVLIPIYAGPFVWLLAVVTKCLFFKWLFK